MMFWSKVTAAAACIGMAVLVGGGVVVSISHAEPSAPSAKVTFPPATITVAANGERILHFPPGVSLGILSVREDTVHQYAGNDWDYLAVASGEVTIPAGKQMELKVSEHGINQLEALAALPADMFYRITMNLMNAGDISVAAISHFTKLKSLEVHQNKITDRAAPSLVKLTALENISFDSAELGPNCLKAIGRMLFLREMGLYHTEITNSALGYLSNLQNLEILDLGYTNISNDGLAKLHDFPKLWWLRLNGTHITDKSMEHIAQWKNIKSLELSRTGITDAGIKFIATLPQLEELNLFDVRVTETSMADIARIRTLKTLNLPNKITNIGLAMLKDHPSLETIDESWDMDEESVKILTTLPKLNNLTLNGKKITDTAMEHVAKMVNLKNLSLYRCNVGDNGFAKLSTLTSLENLALGYTQITEEGFSTVQAFKKLKQIRLHGQTPIFHGGLGYLQALPELEIFQIYGENITIDDVVLADIGKLSHLTFVLISKYSDKPSPTVITDEGFAHLKNLSKLYLLAIETNSQLTDRSLEVLSQLRELESITLRGNFTDEGLKYMEGMPKLYQLHITGTFSDAAKEHLSASTPSLQRLEVLEEDDLQIKR